MQKSTLTPRLLLVAELCTQAKKVIDVGCDHARLSIELAKSAERVVASDIREGPIANAQRNISAAGLDGKIETFLCAGLDAFSPTDADTIVICGMGGEMIAEILENAPWTALGGHKIVMQPMTAADKLRRYLSQRGFETTDERFAAEGRRIYCVICAEGGAKAHTAPNYALFSEKACSAPLFTRYISHLCTKQRRICTGLSQSGKMGGEPFEVLKMLEETQCHLTL